MNWRKFKKLPRRSRNLFSKIFGHYGYLYRAKWWFLHRTFDKYHIVNTGLKPGYYDADYRMEEAMYSLLKDFVEIERGGLEALNYRIEWLKKEPTIHQTFVENDIAVRDVYLWATIERPAMEKKRDDLISRYHNGRNEWHEVEEEMRNKDTEMLKLLVEVRGCLWT